MSRIEVRERREALHPLAREIAVGHGMTKDGNAHPAAAQSQREPACQRRLTAARANCRNRDHREGRRQHCALRPQQDEIGADSDHAGGDVHHLLMRNVAVGKDDLIDRMGAAKRFEFALFYDRDAVWVEWARE